MSNSHGRPRRLSAGTVLISMIAAETAVGPYLADWNETHIYNPTWPPHAKFHNGQTMSMGACLAAMTLWQLWQTHDSPAAARQALDSASLGQSFPEMLPAKLMKRPRDSPARTGYVALWRGKERHPQGGAILRDRGDFLRYRSQHRNFP